MGFMKFLIQLLIFLRVRSMSWLFLLAAEFFHEVG